ncbi:MAG: TlpA family protein disulfide reductase, partial [Hyphomicrobiales bacterium]
FASWCPPCKAEFEALNRVRERYPGDRLAIVAVNAFEAWGGKENPARMARFLKRTEPSFYVVKGSDEILKVYGNIERIPTLILFDAQGREAWRFVHERGAAKMSASADDILAVLKRLEGS